MSRIGRMPVVIPAGVTVDVKDGNVVTVKGAKGELTRQFAPEMKITVQEVEKEIDEKMVKVNEILVERPNDLKREKSLHGLTRSLLQNMVTGVSDGYKKTLEINGVGYRAAKSGKKLTLNLGYSHPIEMEDPEGIETAVDGNKVIVSGIDKEKVGQYAAQIREVRSRIRARASSMTMRSSGARSVRPVNNQGGV